MTERSARRGLVALVAASAISAGSVLAAPVIQCRGEAPRWKLGLGEAFADFTYKDRQIRLEVPQRARAEGRDWPRAYTLVGRTDTAIVVLDRDACRAEGRDYPVSADVLTQDGTRAILLSGCCDEIDD